VPVPPRNPQPRPPLTEAEILDAALVLLDARGPGAATIRRIAAAVGAAPSTVYTYFPDQAAVGRALVDRLVGEVGDAVTCDGRWERCVEALALALRSRLIAHPGAVPLLLGVAPAGPNADALGRRLIDLMTGAGMTDRYAARSLRLVTAYVLGAIALGGDLEQFAWGLRRVLRGLRT